MEVVDTVTGPAAQFQIDSILHDWVSDEVIHDKGTYCLRLTIK